jgi:hypothetical protein
MRGAPALFGGHSSSAPSGVLDSYTTGLWLAVSTQKLLSAYAGPVLRVRRSSDNTEQDVSFSGTSWDTAGMLSFAGAGSAYAAKWYNQEGTTARDLVQATAANQPRTVNAGGAESRPTWDGSNDFMASGTNSGTPTGFSVFIKLTSPFLGLRLFYEHTVDMNAGSNDGCVYYFNPPLLVGGMTDNGATNQVNGTWAQASTPATVYGMRFDRTLGSKPDQVILWADGTKTFRTSNSDVGGAVAGNFSAAAWYLGARSGGSFALDGGIDTFVIYESALSDSDMSAIALALA